MITKMRTTITFDDRLFHEARQQAAREGLTLSALVDRAVRQSLREQPASDAPAFRMVTWDGGEARSVSPQEMKEFLAQEDFASLKRRD